MNEPAVRREQQIEAAEQFHQRKADAIDRVAAVTNSPMAKGEREQLLKVVRLRTRVAKEDVNARQALILAQGEAALARQFREDDDAFAEVMTEARTYMAEVKDKLNAKCAELGIPAEFRPGASLHWFSRGENADPRRRAELRAVLRTQAEATAKAAKVEVDRWSAELQGQIISGGLAGEARELLDRLPTAEALMPPLELPELGR